MKVGRPRHSRVLEKRLFYPNILGSYYHMTTGLTAELRAPTASCQLKTKKYAGHVGSVREVSEIREVKAQKQKKPPKRTAPRGAAESVHFRERLDGAAHFLVRCLSAQ
jgi:hypothetical protein